MKKKKTEYISETKEFKKLELEEKDNIETIDENVLKEKLKLRRKRIKMVEIIILTILLIVGILSYARFISTKGLVIKEHAIKTKDIPKEYDGLKLLQFSDLHYGSTVFESELDTLIETINDEHPDIVIFTGDLIEEKVELTNVAIL